MLKSGKPHEGPGDLIATIKRMAANPITGSSLIDNPLLLIDSSLWRSEPRGEPIGLIPIKFLKPY